MGLEHSYITAEDLRVLRLTIDDVADKYFFMHTPREEWNFSLDDADDLLEQAMNGLYDKFFADFTHFSNEDLYDYPTQAELAEFLEAQGY